MHRQNRSLLHSASVVAAHTFSIFDADERVRGLHPLGAHACGVKIVSCGTAWKTNRTRLRRTCPGTSMRMRRETADRWIPCFRRLLLLNLIGGKKGFPIPETSKAHTQTRLRLRFDAVRRTVRLFYAICKHRGWALRVCGGSGARKERKRIACQEKHSLHTPPKGLQCCWVGVLNAE